MDSYVILLVIFVSSFLVFGKGIEDRALEKQLKLLNRPAVKSLSNDYGDIYDCVDFYQQPAFDHPSLKNHTFHFQMKPRIFHKKTIYHASSNLTKHVSLTLKGGGCPIGTVPIRRITKEDLIREKLASKIRPMAGDDAPGADYAVLRTNFGSGSKRIAGVRAAGQSVYSPPVQGQQYSAGRIKIQNGNDSIEAGWRVDPSLYNDSSCRFYIRTDADQTHCFDTRCPGFVVVSQGLTFDAPYPQTSVPGGQILELKAGISRDPNSGDWWLIVGVNDVKAGFWPKSIFSTTGLQNLASQAEWGGEVFSPAGTAKPEMGSGSYDNLGDTSKDAFFRQLEVQNPDDQTWYDPGVDNTEVFTSDISTYITVDAGNVGDIFGHLIFYGGPRKDPKL